jgi:hypothetical protein
MKRHSIPGTLIVLSLFSLPALSDPPSNKRDDRNHGQVVSECNHRANDRNMKAQDRKQWVEWCEERGSRYSYDDHRWTAERTCYQRADSKGLSGDKRRKFLDECFENQRYDDSKYNTKDSPRGKDVLGKSKPD